MRLRRVIRAEWDVLAVCTPRGECPLRELLADLPANLAADGRSMLRLFSFIAEQGPPRNVEVSHKIMGEIWELIAGRLRVLWFYGEGRSVVCSHGFVKRTKKTPPIETYRAQAAANEYQIAMKRRDFRIEG